VTCDKKQRKQAKNYHRKVDFNNLTSGAKLYLSVVAQNTAGISIPVVYFGDKDALEVSSERRQRLCKRG